MASWIEEWFGSKYYSILYKHRTFEEAKFFIDNLIAFLKISPDSKILDCGCGKGRHAIYLGENHFDVTGVDLCENNIIEAKKHEKKNLSFFTHDMRNLFRINYFDVALNLFTSFGYYTQNTDNNKVIRSISASLKKGGWFVLDFMNVEKEIRKLIPYETFQIDGIVFEVKRFVKDDCIAKEIVVSDKEKKYSFRENVKLYRQKELENFYTLNKLELLHLFGNYELKPFNKNDSERLIIIGKKK